MKLKHLSLLFLLIGAISACAFRQTSDQPTETPTATTAPTNPPSPTPTLTETPTPTPTPEGAQYTSDMIPFSVFLPAGFDSITGIYRYEYAYAAVYQGEEYWERAIIFIDMDVTDEIDYPIEVFLLLALDNLDYFNAVVEDVGAAGDIDTNFPGSQAIDFTGNTKGVPIQGQIISFKTGEDHVLIGLGWFDVSTNPDAWNNEGIYLFHYALDKFILED